MSEENAIVPVITPQVLASPIRMSLDTVQGFEALQRAAKMFAASNLVPKAYQGNIANCVIALNIALRMQADPLMVLQSLDIIHGRPSWRATFLIAAVNNSGKYAPLRFVFSGVKGADNWGCRAVSKDLKTGTLLEGSEITIAMAKAEGWYGKDGSKWKTMPEQMLMYRAAGFWTRVYSPDVTMGFQTTEEIEDMEGITVVPPASVVEGAEVVAVVTTDHPKPHASPPPAPAAEVVQPVAPTVEVTQAQAPEPPKTGARAAHAPAKGKGVESVKATLERLRAKTQEPTQGETQGTLLPDSEAPKGPEGEVK